MSEMNAELPTPQHAIQVIRASALADQMTLSGVPSGGGDIALALGRLGLRLVLAREEPLAIRDFSNEKTRLDEISGWLTEAKTCPRCNAEVIRLKDRGDGASGSWFHRRHDWGFRRACAGPRP